MNKEFKAVPAVVEGRTIVVLPEAVSAKLPSRGMVMAEVTMEGRVFEVPLEPDGRGSHWFEVPPEMSGVASISEGEMVTVMVADVAAWPAPSMPSDILSALEAEALMAVWQTLTTKAQWSWLRWVRSTKVQATRTKRIGVMCDKLKKGDRRPCCFDQTRCTVPELSKSGVLNV